MTVTYGDECSTVRNVGNYWRLLYRWKASVYKLVWVDLVLFLCLYYAMGGCYNFLLTGYLRELFEKLCLYCENQMNLIPLSFVLGFYVTNILSRWEQQFLALPTIDAIAIFLSASIVGRNEKARIIRRTVVRYLNLSFILMMMIMCTPVRKRFPTLNHLVAAGMLFETEKQAFDVITEKMPEYNIYWVPLIWAADIIAKARRQNQITHDIYVETILQKICEYRSLLGTLLTYDWITIPLVYTQVVTLAVYTFFLSALFGRQVLREDSLSHPIDLYFPVFTILQFLFYMGWLKVAETLLNPFGEDDDDFEINWLIDRNVQTSYAIVDDVLQKSPDLLKDQFWDQIIPDPLPHTPESQKLHNQPAPILEQPSIRPLSMSTKTASEILKSQHFQTNATAYGVARTTQANILLTQHPEVESFWKRYFSFTKNKNVEVTASVFKNTRLNRQFQTRLTDLLDPKIKLLMENNPEIKEMLEENFNDLLEHQQTSTDKDTEVDNTNQSPSEQEELDDNKEQCHENVKSDIP